MSYTESEGAALSLLCVCNHSCAPEVLAVQINRWDVSACVHNNINSHTFRQNMWDVYVLAVSTGTNSVKM